ncbi:hypothetical protein NDU88_005584 [Pleurodeles waltl]|uniref:Uncharacterized protein n=1 Tax=Pleurodeles waltl TaxID=8319 RepID=A0AAV7MBN2_PLEWA|nr:hypothetical protein NDU88_005584 [Pleurodeles waltl]
MAQATTKVAVMEERLEDAEGRSRQNNVCLLGFSEHAEGSTLQVFVARWIRDVLQPVGLSNVFVVERAHRALVTSPRPGALPRAIIARLLNYKDRDCILRAARETDKAVFENWKISIYPAYTNKVQTSRKGFLEVKAKLSAMNIRYMLLYPARLKVLLRGRSYFFEHPKAVWKWLEMWDKVALCRSGRAGSVAGRVSGVDSSDWKHRRESQMKVSAVPQR